MGLVLLGSGLTMPYTNTMSSSDSLIGITTGIASGITYAFYTVFAQKSFQKLHPVPFTWLSFAITLVLSGASLLLSDVHEAQLSCLPLCIGGLLSAIFTFAGHLMNNYGIRLSGATSASMIGVSNPALTVVLAWLIIQETLTSLQVTGVAIVTLSVVLLSREHR